MIQILLVVFLISSGVFPLQEKEVLQPSEELERLREENRRLKEKIKEMARELFLLRQRIKDLQKKPSPITLKEDTHARSIIKGVVLVNSEEEDRIVIKPGLKGGVRSGDRFQVKRGARVIAIVEIEKVLERYSIAKVISGKREDIKIYDEVMLILPHMLGLEEGPPKLKSPKITGVLGEGKYLVNFGRLDGLRKGEKLYIIQNGGLKAILVVTSVEDEYSICKLEEPYKGIELKLDQQLCLTPPVFLLKGRIRICNQRIIGMDIGSEKGARPGQIYIVKRGEETVAEVKVKEVFEKWSVVEVLEGYKREHIKVGDVVLPKSK